MFLSGNTASESSVFQRISCFSSVATEIQVIKIENSYNRAETPFKGTRTNTRLAQSANQSYFLVSDGLFSRKCEAIGQHADMTGGISGR